MMAHDPSAPDDEGFYFGWISPSRTEPDSEKFDFGVHAEQFPPEIVEEFEEIVGVIPRIRPTLIDFLVLRADFEQLMALRSELGKIFATSRFVMFDAGVRNIESHVTAERRLSSFLNSASAFRDRVLVRISGDVQAKSAVRRKINELYDRSFGYRLCYNLRNFSQHHSNPLHIIPVNGRRNAEGKMEYQIDLELDRDRLVSPESKFQPKVKAELSRMAEKIPLIKRCKEYYSSLQELFLAYLSLSGPDLQRVTSYEFVVRRQFPHMPADATPLMFQGKPKKVEGEFKTKATSFSFDELNLLKQVLVEMAASGAAA